MSNILILIKPSHQGHYSESDEISELRISALTYDQVDLSKSGFMHYYVFKIKPHIMM